MAKKKRNKQPIWKRITPEIKHVSDHIGKIIDSGAAVDYLLNGGLAIVGIEQTGDIRGALIGPIALKLAQSGNILAGGAGLAMLAAMGLAAISTDDYIRHLPEPLRIEKTQEEIDQMNPLERIFYMKKVTIG